MKFDVCKNCKYFERHYVLMEGGRYMVHSIDDGHCKKSYTLRTKANCGCYEEEDKSHERKQVDVLRSAQAFKRYCKYTMGQIDSLIALVKDNQKKA
ncbi:MAG: hypothetical protein E7351_01250 [Clostridiales bacterium]|nr:hypothetical protein [Clostridiales bacterium]